MLHICLHNLQVFNTILLLDELQQHRNQHQHLMHITQHISEQSVMLLTYPYQYWH